MEELTLVKMLVMYPSPHDAERQEMNWHKFYDVAPDFPGTVQAVEGYQDLPGVEIKVWYHDPDDKPEMQGTHEGTMFLQ